MQEGAFWVKRVRKGGERKGVSFEQGGPSRRSNRGGGVLGFGKEILRGPRESRREALRNWEQKGCYTEIGGFDCPACLSIYREV